MAIALWSDGRASAMSHVLADHKLDNLTPVSNWSAGLALPKTSVALADLVSNPVSRTDMDDDH